MELLDGGKFTYCNSSKTHLVDLVQVVLLTELN